MHILMEELSIAAAVVDIHKMTIRKRKFYAILLVDDANAHEIWNL